MNLILLVHIQKRREHLLRHVGNRLFGERDLGVEKVRETARVHVLHDNLRVIESGGPHPELVVEVVRVHDVHDGGALRAHLEGDLLAEHEKVAVVFEHLHGVLAASLGNEIASHHQRSQQLHHTVRALPQLLPARIYLAGVVLLHVNNYASSSTREKTVLNECVQRRTARQLQVEAEVGNVLHFIGVLRQIVLCDARSL